MSVSVIALALPTEAGIILKTYNHFSMTANLSLGGASAGTGTSDLSIDDIIAAIPIEARFDNSGKYLVVGDLIPNLTESELQLAVDKMYLPVKDRCVCVGVT